METNLISTITKLIEKKTEGGYWDFKKCWHSNKADLLHDIICMANNIENKDAYIIIGVANSGEFSKITNDPNRRNTAKLTDFLRTVSFVGQYRPTVRVETLAICGNEVDVIVVENSTNTPYVLDNDYVDNGSATKSNESSNNKPKNRTVKQGNIYTRIQDTNTPKDKTADFDKVELLWRKRFYLDASPIEKLLLFLKDTDGWEKNSFQNGWYYKYSNELFEIRDQWTVYTKKTDTVWDYFNFYGDWSRYNIEIVWQNLIIKTYEVLSNSKYSIITPYCENIDFDNGVFYSIWCYVKGSDKELIQRLLERDYEKSSRSLRPIDVDFYSQNIVFYQDENEKSEFKQYLNNNWACLKTEFDKQLVDKAIDEDILKHDYRCVKFFPRIFKEWKKSKLQKK